MSQRPARIEKFGHQCGPAGLMGGADPASAVAMEIFIEEQMIPELRIVLQAFAVAVDGPLPVFVELKKTYQPGGKLFGPL